MKQFLVLAYDGTDKDAKARRIGSAGSFCGH
jgi:hypothetical protein